MPGPGKPFKAGDPRPAGAGRQPGQPNYVTKNLRDLILQAADEVGFVKRIEKFDAENKSIGFEPVSTGDEGVKGYLKWAAVHQPARFLAMLTRILPMQINAKTERPGFDRMSGTAPSRRLRPTLRRPGTATKRSSGWSPT